MKVKDNGRPVTHPMTRSRRERALVQRQAELAEWKDPESNRVKEYVSELKFADPANAVARKVMACEGDIKNLERKLKGAA